MLHRLRGQLDVPHPLQLNVICSFPSQDFDVATALRLLDQLDESVHAG